MKNIKKFEELNLSTYRSAASKLANIRHVKRSSIITQYADKIESAEKEEKEKIRLKNIEDKRISDEKNYLSIKDKISKNGLYNISLHDYKRGLDIPKAHIGISFDSYESISWFNECDYDDEYEKSSSCSFYLQVANSLDFDFDRDIKLNEYYCDFIIHYDFSKDDFGKGIVDFNDFSLENLNLKDRASAGRFLSYLKRFISTSDEVKKFESYLESKGYKYTSILNYVKTINPNKLYIE